jgi:hypothetical protein
MFLVAVGCLMLTVAHPGPVLAGDAAAGSPSRAEARAELPEAPAAYQALLETFVVRYPMRNGGFESRFAYSVFHADPNQEQTRAGIRAALLAVDPDDLEPAARTAWAVNTYNFTVIDLVIEHYIEVDGDTLASIADIGAGNFAVFDEPLIPVMGDTFSLNRFENHFLFEDIDRTSPVVPPALDPRLHFVIVCGALGCPALWPEAFRGDRLESQIAEATTNALQSNRQVIFEGKRIQVSKIFEWYAADFLPTGATEAFLRRHAAERVRRAIMEGRVQRYDPSIEWDWRLNRP